MRHGGTNPGKKEGEVRLSIPAFPPVGGLHAQPSPFSRRHRRSGRWSSRRSVAAEARIEVLLDEAVGTVAPKIYGHLAEHLGGVVYDGIWVGEGSRIANVRGVRKEIDGLSDAAREVARGTALSGEKAPSGDVMSRST